MTEVAIFAAGCFWGVQYYFDQVEGVIETTVGYTGGRVAKPTYEQVCYEDTGHAEAIRIVFDPLKISFKELLEQFFNIHDPTLKNRQGPDVGEQYRSAVFYLTSEQRSTTESMITSIKSKYHEPISTEIVKAGMFWQAEKYHQKYTERTGVGACHIVYKGSNK